MDSCKPKKSLVYDKESRIAHSIIFGYQDLFGPTIRIWSTNGNTHYVTSLLRTGYYSSPVRIILNMNSCATAIGYHETVQNREINWRSDAKLQILNLEAPFYMYVGLMYVASYYFEREMMYIQFGDRPPARSWRETHFHKFK